MIAGTTRAVRRWGRGPTLPAGSEKRTGEAARAEYATKKWVNSQTDALTKAIGAYFGKIRREQINPLQQEIEQGRKATDAIGRVVDRLSNELAVLRRDFDLQQKLEAQRNNRRVESLEIALIAAGRNPAEVEAEAELPGSFSQWNGGGHAQ
jgi:hypothetical protein